MSPGQVSDGKSKGEKGWADQEDETQHEVTLTKGFWIGKYEVTQEQWQAVGRLKNPSYDKGPENPVDGVTWKVLKPFLKKLGKGFRLPTETEWEYACRAGSTTRFCFGDDEAQLGDYAWCGKNNQVKTHPVGQKKPNAWGIHDMHGNLWEWCADWYADYPQEPVTDPTGPRVGERRVVRGGYWGSLPRECRCAKRRAINPQTQESLLGFRVAADSLPSLAGK